MNKKAVVKSKEEIIADIEYALRYSVDNYILLSDSVVSEIRVKARELYKEVEDRVCVDNNLPILDEDLRKGSR